MIDHHFRYPSEFGTPETTVAVHSLQFAGFLLNICHVLLVVDDLMPDPATLAFLRTAEMLKPSSLAVVDEENPDILVEYFPDMIFIHNKAPLEDFSGAKAVATTGLVGTAIGPDSQLRVRTGLASQLVEQASSLSQQGLPSVCKQQQHQRKGKKHQNAKPLPVNMFVLPDMEQNDDDGVISFYSFSDECEKLRRMVLSAPKRNLSTKLRMTERSWFAHASKSWEAVKGSSFYSEYSKQL